MTFELEGRAELDVCTEETLGRLVAAGGHRTKVVFLAACDSERPGKALARTGIPHVVCVRAGARLSDRTARAFADEFNSPTRDPEEVDSESTRRLSTRPPPTPAPPPRHPAP